MKSHDPIRLLHHLDVRAEPPEELRINVLALLGNKPAPAIGLGDRIAVRDSDAMASNEATWRRRGVWFGVAVGLVTFVVVLIGSSALSWLLTGTSETRPDGAGGATTAQATTAVNQLPIPIPSQSELRPLASKTVVSPDWQSFDAPPIDARWPAALFWSGEEIVVWGGEPVGGGATLFNGAAFDPRTERWRTIAEFPLRTSAPVEALWTGSELVVWTEESVAAAWSPRPNRWRLIEDWPIFPGPVAHVVWNGEKILDIGGGVLVDPVDGSVEPMADPPSLLDSSVAVVTDSSVVLASGEGQYDTTEDSWSEMPQSALSPSGVSAVWTGTAVIATDYQMKASSFDVEANRWHALPDIPLRVSECVPSIAATGDFVAAAYCTGIAIWNEDSKWIPLSQPSAHRVHRSDLVNADGRLYVWADRLYRLKTAAVDTPRRLAFATGFFDLPDGWSIEEISTRSNTSPDSATVTRVEIIGGGESCTALALSQPTVGGSAAILASYIGHDPTVVSVTPIVGGAPYQALLVPSNRIDRRSHLVWPMGTTDVVDLACDDMDVSHVMARNIWSAFE